MAFTVCKRTLVATGKSVGFIVFASEGVLGATGKPPKTIENTFMFKPTFCGRLEDTDVTTG